MKMKKWWLTMSSVVVGASIVLAFLVLAPQRGLAFGMMAPSAPGMEVSPGYGLDVDADSVVTYSHVITNTGDDALFGVQASTSEGWPVDYTNAMYPDGTTVLMPFALQAGEVATIGVRLTVPPDVIGGTVNTTTVSVALIVDSTIYMSAVEYDIATVKMRRFYLPMVVRHYDRFDNGDFSDGLCIGSRMVCYGPGWRWTRIIPVTL